MANIIDEIEKHPRPGDLANWWGQEDPRRWTVGLEDEERAYMEVFTSPAVPPAMRMGRGVTDPNALSADEQAAAKKTFGDTPAATQMYANRENRRRIVAHYVWSHPATIQYEIGLYRLTRDANPVTFLLERFQQLVSGREAFTGAQVSRLGAAVDLAVPLVVGRVLGAARAQVTPAPAPSGRLLTDPIYDLPAGGGGMKINGRWYTEHALERMAPDTPAVRAQLRTQATQRLVRLGLSPDTPAWNRALGRALQKIDPRGVPPSVVEAEIGRPGSTNVRVITAKGGQVVVTVIPR